MLSRLPLRNQSPCQEDGNSQLPPLSSSLRLVSRVSRLAARRKAASQQCLTLAVISAVMDVSPAWLSLLWSPLTLGTSQSTPLLTGDSSDQIQSRDCCQAAVALCKLLLWLCWIIFTPSWSWKLNMYICRSSSSYVFISENGWRSLTRYLPCHVSESLTRDTLVVRSDVTSQPQLSRHTDIPLQILSGPASGGWSARPPGVVPQSPLTTLLLPSPGLHTLLTPLQTTGPTDYRLSTQIVVISDLNTGQWTPHEPSCQS